MCIRDSLQFVVDRAGTVVGAEAVSRWQNPEEGLLLSLIHIYRGS